MFRFRLTFALCFACLLVPTTARAADPFRYPEKKLAGKGELKYVQNAVPVLIVEGTPEEMGEQVGLLAARPGQKICDYPRDYVKRARLEILWLTLIKDGEILIKGVPADHQAEMEALVKASGIERERVIADNTMFDLKRMLAGSALIVEADRSGNGDAQLARRVRLARLASEASQRDRSLADRIIESEVQLNSLFSRHRGRLGGRDVNDNEIAKILRESSDREQRRQAWEASKSIGPQAAPRVRELAHSRNDRCGDGQLCGGHALVRTSHSNQ